jgi:hypothetical protein
MARLRDADGGDGRRIWWVAGNILNKHLRTADKGGPPAWGLGEGLTAPHRKKKNLLGTKCRTGRRNWTDCSKCLP